MYSKKRGWYKYTADGPVNGSREFKIEMPDYLAELGGLVPCWDQNLPEVPTNLTTRYIWLREKHAPSGKRPSRRKVIVETHKLNVLRIGTTVVVGGVEMFVTSIIGEASRRLRPRAHV
jgi:hypothetical protein